jgi:oxalate decarboxylase/phosphoglucose isomerase-like protein (cupin superfamily)
LTDIAPQAQEWVYFHKGTARVTVFIGGSKARTFDFGAGDTAVFPTNSGMSNQPPVNTGHSLKPD